MAADRLIHGPGDREGQLHGEDGALPLARALRMDRSAMRLRDVLHDRESEAQPAMRPGRARFALLEPLEDEGQHLGPNALTVVGHGDLDVRIDPLERYLNAS